MELWTYTSHNEKKTTDRILDNFRRDEKWQECWSTYTTIVSPCCSRWAGFAVQPNENNKGTLNIWYDGLFTPLDGYVSTYTCIDSDSSYKTHFTFLKWNSSNRWEVLYAVFYQHQWYNEEVCFLLLSMPFHSRTLLLRIANPAQLIIRICNLYHGLGGGQHNNLHI